MQMLQQRFGDEWRQQLHNLRKSCESLYCFRSKIHDLTGNSELTDGDMDNISAFALRMEGAGLPRTSYLNLRRFFRHKLALDTEYLMHRRIEILSGVKPTFFHMCINNCLLYVGQFSEHSECPICGAPRYHTNGKPAAQFSYLPLIPRLQAWYECIPMIQRLKYRSEYSRTPGEMSDIFDGSHYRSLLDRLVVVNGEQQSHKYFSDPRDIALGGSTDGFQVCFVRSYFKINTHSFPGICCQACPR